MASKVARYGLGIDVDQYEKKGSQARGNDYVEELPRTGEVAQSFVPTVNGFKHYIRELFPFYNWIWHYNLTWLAGDIIAGVTVGFVVVPQGMAYALLAKLPPEYGLYTSFVGFLLYWAFATSKDITIGTVAVMSQVTGNVVIRVQAEYPDLTADNIARGLALIVGVVLLFLGLFRLGFLVEFISLVAIASFMTGAAISIGAGQVPALLGISGINTRDATYSVIIETLKGLPRAKLDAAMGLTALFALYAVRIGCSFMAKKFPHQQKTWFFISTLRMAVIILLYTVISWAVVRNYDISKAATHPFKVLGPVPSGFRVRGAPTFVNKRLLTALAPDIPVSILVVILEHIAISKSFGRVNNYIINPSQELVAVGFTNVFGPFLGGYPCTGSFSRTAIKSKAGVRTPLAGIWTAVVVLLALYALTGAFSYIPMSSLAALIIHAVGDLITPPRVVFHFWKTSPIEVIIFFGGVLLTIFTNIENGIYLTIAASAAVQLLRLMLSLGRFYGRTTVRTVVVPASEEDQLKGSGLASDRKGTVERRVIFVPAKHQDGSNPGIPIESPYPGVFIYHFQEGFNYLNSTRHLDYITNYVYEHTRQTVSHKDIKKGDLPWNIFRGPGNAHEHLDENLPLLRAIILDFAGVDYVDGTSVQALVDLRTQFSKHADPEPVEWHFANVTNRWTKRGLVSSGFGSAPLDQAVDVSDSSSEQPTALAGADDLEKAPGAGATSGSSSTSGDSTALLGKNRPFFHIDLLEAVAATIANIEARESALK